ncbi:hypothetical protein Tco_1037228, partial [Tanacetum coccineum]
KIGIFPLTTLEPAKRSSKNRVAGTLETKPILSVTKEVTRSWLIQKAIQSLQEEEVLETIDELVREILNIDASRRIYWLVKFFFEVFIPVSFVFISWRWKLNPNGKFTVNNLSKLIDIANLLLRGLTISYSLCPLCGLEVESLHHIILSCLVVSQLWSKFWKWWHINQPPNMSSILDVLDFSPPISKDHCKIYQALLYVFIREIWSWRNRFVHADLVSLSSIRNEDIFTQAQLLSLLWISSRGIKSSIDWITWKSNPFSILLRVM